MAYVYFVATLTTLEKRFKIPSKTTGIVMSGNEISQILLSLTLSYYGGQGNRPLWIAWGVAFSGLSCYILVLPHMVYGPGQNALALTKEYLDSHFYNATSENKDDSLGVCPAASYKKNCEDDMATILPLILIFLSQFVLGIGSTLYYALGQPYLDDNVKKTRTPMLLGLVLALRTLGPALGFALGSGCLSLYIDPTVTPLITNKDPRWLGAWWLGWIVLGSTMLLFSIVIALFPRRLPRPVHSGKRSLPTLDSSAKQRPNEEQPLTKNMLSDFMPVDPVPHAPGASAITVEGFKTVLKKLLMNKLLMANIFAGVFYILGVAGYMTYPVKYMETQFQISAARANIIAGVPAILATMVGFLASGYVISRFKPRAGRVLGWNVLVGCVYISGEIVFILLGCKDIGLYGFHSTRTDLHLINDCNRNCNCDNVKYTPVCSEMKGMTYYSACHAGCSYVFNNSQGFGNCTCLSSLNPVGTIDGFSDTNSTDTMNTVISGPCAMNCGYRFIIFLIVLCSMHFLGSTGKIGNILVNYRCVATKDKSFAQGLSLVLVSLLAFIPGPIIYGAIIDATCLVWNQTCGQKGNCWLYHKDDFRLHFNITAAGFTTVGVLLDVVVWRLGRGLDLYEETNTRNVRTGSRDDIQQQLKR
jgi:sodium-independent organic anion transporter